MWLQRVRHYFCHLGQVDPRSLACFRIALSLVILYDIALAWPLLNVWLGMQGLYAGLPLPLFFKIGSDEQILRAIFAGYALLAVGLLLGYKTRWCTLLVWIVSCGHQYAARATYRLSHRHHRQFAVLVPGAGSGRKMVCGCLASTKPAPERWSDGANWRCRSGVYFRLYLSGHGAGKERSGLVVGGYGAVAGSQRPGLVLDIGHMGGESTALCFVLPSGASGAGG